MSLSTGWHEFHQRQLQINLRPLMLGLAIMGKPRLPRPGLM